MRRAAVSRFPYVIFFAEGTEAVEVVAGAHGHRKPGYWLHRVRHSWRATCGRREAEQDRPFRRL